jgi:hypothetical protein
MVFSLDMSLHFLKGKKLDMYIIEKNLWMNFYFYFPQNLISNI